MGSRQTILANNDHNYDAIDNLAYKIGEFGEQIQDLAVAADKMAFPSKGVDLMFQAYNAWNEACKIFMDEVFEY